MTIVSENNVNGGKISAEVITSLWKLGFKPVPLAHNHIPYTKWTPIYDDINYWQEDSFSNLEVQGKFINVASTFGRTHLKDSQNRTLFIQALDIDSEAVFHLLNVLVGELYVIEKLRPALDELIKFSRKETDKIMNITLLDLFKKITFVTKTKKQYGYHIWWLSHEQNKSILTLNCKKGYEFEVKTDKKSGLCTLPPSTSRYDKDFRYASIGQNQQLLISDSVYELFLELLQQCLILNDCNRSIINNNDLGLNKSNTGKFTDLSQDAITTSAILLSSFYREKSRNNFVLHFSGYAYHCNISENSTSKIISEICTMQKDEAKHERHSTICATYKKALDHKPVTGGPTFIEFISQVGDCSIAQAQKTLDNIHNVWLNDIKKTSQNTKGTSNDNDDYDQDGLCENILSVSQAKMYHEGRFKVRGKIMKCSGSFKMISATNYSCSNQKCNFKTKTRHLKPLLLVNDRDSNGKCPQCGKLTITCTLEYINAVDLELQDVDNVNDIDRLLVFLFEENIKSLKIGETVIIDGNISVINKNDNKRKKLIAVLYGNSISYEHDEKIELTQEDIQEINRLKKEIEMVDTEGIVKNDWIEYLVSRFAPQIARNYYPKIALLLAAVNSGPDEIFRKRDRIHVLLVGEPGLAKTKLLEDVIELVPNSKYMSMSNTSGISLTAMIEKDESGGGYSVRAGSMVLAKNAIFAANEIGDLNFKNQLYLGDIMEEGVTHISKYTIDAQLVAPVTMISACNPIGTYWKYPDHIDPSEIPLPPKEIDRYDLQFFLRMPRDKLELKAFASELRQCDKKHLNSFDYTFLRKVIIYAKQFKSTLSEDAISEIENFWIEVATQRGSVRIKNVLERLTKAFAKLRFKSVADLEDASEAIRLYKYVSFQYDIFDNPHTVPRNPQHMAADVCMEILQENPLVDKRIDDLVNIACSINPQVASYFSGEKKLRKSYKTRAVKDILIQNQNIKQVGNSPITLQWFEKIKQLDNNEQTNSKVIPSSLSNPSSLTITPIDQTQRNTTDIYSEDDNQKLRDKTINQSDECDQGDVYNQQSNYYNKNNFATSNVNEKIKSLSDDEIIKSHSTHSSHLNDHYERIPDDSGILPSNNSDNNDMNRDKIYLLHKKTAEIHTNEDLEDQKNDNLTEEK
jgi:DNA replicative helicase MCM subunit Mcm2 (Cdc46/Mcm family)